MTVDAHEGSDQRAGEGFGAASGKKVMLLYGALILSDHAWRFGLSVEF